MTSPQSAQLDYFTFVDRPPLRCGTTVSRPPTSGPAAPDVESGDVLRRARELALRPDVTALVALREAVLRRAEEAARKDDPAIVREIQAIDRYLFEARALRLRLDAAAIRKGT